MDSKQKKIIISVSRRTDIPAFFGDWFQSVLNLKYADVKNPFNQKKEIISLHPENVSGFVFWSRYPISLLKVLDYIDNNYGKNHYINFTINAYPKELETRVPKLSKVLSIVDYLFDRYGENYIRWRFDPIIISNLTSKDFIFDKFLFLCNNLKGKVKTCITSFVDFYPKVIKRIIKSQIIKVRNLDFEEQVEIFSTINRIAKEFGIELLLCCEKEISKELKIKEASCVNPIYFEDNNYNELEFNQKPTRKGCTCIESKDIGFYNSCLFDCVYCYSNLSYDYSFKNFRLIKSRIKVSTDSYQTSSKSAIDKMFEG